MAPYVKAINELKRERDAVILAHNYQTPEIFHCVADIGRRTLLQLAIEATKVKSGIIVQCGVHFMAETSKILNPHKTVSDPGFSRRLLAGFQHHRRRMCGCARTLPRRASRRLCQHLGRRQGGGRYLLHLVHAVQVVESLNAPTVILLPDQYLAKYLASRTGVKIIAWKGACEVHERFTGGRTARLSARPIHRWQIIAHPECPPDVLAEADFTGSTAHMINWVRQNHPKARGDDHRMLDGRQRPGRTARRRNGATVQSVPRT